MGMFFQQKYSYKTKRQLLLFQAFGSALEFVWSNNASEYAIRESTTSIKIHNNFKEKKSFKPEFGADQIFAGPLLGVRGGDSLAFYDWEDAKLIRRIEIDATQVQFRIHLKYDP